METSAQQTEYRYLQQFEHFRQSINGANHVDVKTIDGDVNLREFLANTFNYQPAWMTFLYHVRGVFVRFLGMKQEGVPQTSRFTPEALNLNECEHLNFFKIDSVRENEYIYLSAEESHLKAILGVICESVADGNTRYHAITIVHYKSWAGPIYFNVIRPFHHIVVHQMIRAGIGK